jgi:heptosyltransferase-2
MVSNTTDHILVITLSNLGDIILTTPVITSLRAQFPNAKLTVVVGPKGERLLKGSPEIDRLLIYNKRAGLGHKLELVRTLREASYDVVVDLRNSLLPFLVCAKRRSPLVRFHREQSARERHLEVLKMMNLSKENGRTFGFFSKEDEARLLETLSEKGVNSSEPWVVVAPGAGSDVKRWPIESFREVAQRLLESTSFGLFVVGDEKEAVLGQKLAELDSKRVVNLAGEISLREVAALVSRAKLVLSNDSAVMHLGYELKRPVVAIFGPTDHERYGRTNEIWRLVREFPPCAPCRQAQCRFERRYCLDDLAAEKVFQACEALL